MYDHISIEYSGEDCIVYYRGFARHNVMDVGEAESLAMAFQEAEEGALMSWVVWIAIAVGVALVFYVLYRFADRIDRQEEQERWDAQQREEYARRLESEGWVRQAQWVREGRKW